MFLLKLGKIIFWLLGHAIKGWGELAEQIEEF